MHTGADSSPAQSILRLAELPTYPLLEWWRDGKAPSPPARLPTHGLRLCNLAISKHDVCRRLEKYEIR